MCLIENVRISHDESNHMADDVGGWHSLFNETSGNIYCTCVWFEYTLQYNKTPVYWKNNTTKYIN